MLSIDAARRELSIGGRIVPVGLDGAEVRAVFDFRDGRGGDPWNFVLAERHFLRKRAPAPAGRLGQISRF